MSAMQALNKASLLLDIISFIIIIILIRNNFIIYKNKLKNELTTLVLSVCLLNICEFVFFVVGGYKNKYAFFVVYLVFFQLTVFVLNSFQRVVFTYLKISLKHKYMKNIVAIVLSSIFLIFILIHLLYKPCLISIGDGGNGIVYGWAGRLIIILYGVIVAIDTIAAFSYYLKNRESNAENASIGWSISFFGLIVFFAYQIQRVLIGNYFSSATLAMEIGLMYLLTKLNTKSLIELKTQETLMKADLDLAMKIQMEALPRTNPPYKHHQDISIDVFIKPAKQVGGDFYDYFEIDDNHVCFLIADVAGKGLPAALFMMRAKTIIKDAAFLEKEPHKIIQRANQMIEKDNDFKLFVTVFIGILNTDTYMLEYTNAGHNVPIMARLDGEYELMAPSGNIMVGVMRDAHFSRQCISLFPGDQIILYTDGLCEARNAQGAMVKTEKLIERLNKMADRNGKNAIDTLISYVEDFSQGAEQYDDITILSFKINERRVKLLEDFDFGF